jgi:hypothetical protein
MQSNMPKGWYTDPYDPTQELWWDGAKWHPDAKRPLDIKASEQNEKYCSNCSALLDSWWLKCLKCDQGQNGQIMNTSDTGTLSDNSSKRSKQPHKKISQTADFENFSELEGFRNSIILYVFSILFSVLSGFKDISTFNGNGLSESGALALQFLSIALFVYANAPLVIKARNNGIYVFSYWWHLITAGLVTIGGILLPTSYSENFVVGIVIFSPSYILVTLQLLQVRLGNISSEKSDSLKLKNMVFGFIFPIVLLLISIDFADYLVSYYIDQEKWQAAIKLCAGISFALGGMQAESFPKLNRWPNRIQNDASFQWKKIAIASIVFLAIFLVGGFIAIEVSKN